jgi:magnesium transporter
VYLLNLSRKDPEGHRLVGSQPDNTFEGIPSDGIAGFITRRSMQARRSSAETHGRESLALGDRERLMRAYDVEANASAYGLDDLAEDSEDEDGKKGSDERINSQSANNRLSGSGRARVEREYIKTSKGVER